MRLFRCVAGALLCCMAAALIPATTASAQSPKTQGSPLTAPANYGHDCTTRWVPNLGGTYEPMTFPTPDHCTIMQLGTSLDDTFLVPGKGTVTKARIKSGPNPAPVSIATLRRFFKPNAQGQMEYTCCYGVSETPVVQPTPNAVTEIPVNLLVDAYQPQNGQTGVHDLVAVNVRGPGSLPISDLGPHPIQAPQSMQVTWWQFPRTAPGSNNLSDYMTANFEVLMQYDWTPCTAAAGAATARAAQACGTKAAPPTPGPATPAPTGPAAPAPKLTPAPLAAVRSSALKLKRGKVGVRVACTATTTCKGRVRIRTAAKKPRLLGSKGLSVKPGKTATVSVGVAAKNRRYIKKKGTKVSVEVDLGTAGKITRALTLKR